MSAEHWARPKQLGCHIDDPHGPETITADNGRNIWCQGCGKPFTNQYGQPLPSNTFPISLK